MDEDAQQLRLFVISSNQEAFRALVDRYLGLVIGSALRRCGDHAIAEEIAQDVFTTLAEKAHTLREPLNLAAWLHRCAHLQTSHRLRAEYNRKRKMKSLEDHLHRSALEIEEEASWRDAVPHLDAALDSLSETDREIVLQRYYGDRSFRAISKRLEKSEGATQRRGSRAIAKMSRFLKGRGVTLSAGAIGAGLATQLAVPATAATAAAGTAIASAAVTAASTTTGAAATTVATTTIQVMSSTKIALIAAPLLLLAIPIGYFALIEDEPEELSKAPAIDSHLARRDTGSSPSAFSRNNPTGQENSAKQQDPLPEAIVDELEKLYAKGRPLASSLITVRLSSLSAEEAPYAFDFLEASLEKFNRNEWDYDSMMQTFWLRWGAIDAEAALAKIAEGGNISGGEAYKFTFRGFGESDPEAARNYILANSDLPKRHLAAKGLAVSWAKADPQSATDFVMFDLEGKDQVDGIYMIPWGITNSQGHIAALDWWNELPSDQRHGSAYSGLASIFRQRGNSEDRILLVEDGLASGFRNRTLFTGVAQELGRKDPMRGVRIFSGESPHPETGVYRGFYTLMQEWTRVDQIAADEWIRSQTEQPWIESAIAGYANTLKESEPDLAAEWLEQIENESLRQRAGQ